MPSSTASPAQCLALLPKLSNEDPDIRYMSLNDLCSLLESGSSGFLSNDYHTCAKIIDGIITTLDDQNGEVQNQAIKCLGALVLKLPADILAPFIHRVSNLEPKNSVDASITTTALRKFVTSFPAPLPGVLPSPQMTEAYSAISKVLIPRLIGYVIFQQKGAESLHSPPPGMLAIGTEKGVNGDAVDVLIEIIRCFGPILADAEKQELQKNLMLALDDERTGSVVKKKAVVAISLLCIHLQESLLRSFVSQLQAAFADPRLTVTKRRLLLSVVGSTSRSIPQRLGPFAKNLVPYVLDPLSQDEYEQSLANLEDGENDPELDEVREAALLALEGFLSCCSNAMRPYTNDAIAAAVRYLSYDPNSTDDDDDDMDGTQGDDEDDFTGEDDDDFEQEGAFSDDEDSSWKIRRCAAKALFAVISTRSNGDLLDDGTLYDKVAPVLVKRFKEREENVRLEVLVALGLLIRKTGDGTSFAALVSADTDLSAIENRRSRKRRRVDSDAPSLESAGAFASTLGLSSPATTPSPVAGPRAELSGLSSGITKGVSQLLRQSSSATKQVAVSLLRDLVLVQNGGLSESLPKILEPLLDLIKAPGTSTNGVPSVVVGLAAGSEGNLRIDALQLLAAICDTHSSTNLGPYIEKIVANTVGAANDKFYKISGEALVTLESIIKAITPPRSAGTDPQRRDFLSKINDTIQVKINANDSDLEVRQKALHTLGVLLARTAGSNNTKVFSLDDKNQALNTLFGRLRNETTRLSAVKAVEIVAVSAKDKNDLDAAWTQQVVVELGAQLRKSDRNIRSGSLIALRALISNPVALGKLDDKTIASISKVLSPSLNTGDLNVFSIVSSIFARLVKVSPQQLVNDDLVLSLCEACKTSLSGTAFRSFIDLVESIGEQQAGKDLMQGFLQKVGVSGDPAIVGKAIGTLLVAGGRSVGVGLPDFEAELRASSKDANRQCLALSVIGEAGFRLGSSFTSPPATFTEHFNSKSDLVRRAAATALGRAGASNTKSYLPVILSLTGKAGQAQYLSLFSIKEILLNAGNTRSDISPYSKQIWQNLLQAAQADESRILGAECIGRLTAIEPTSFLPTLQAYLRDSNPAVRSLAIQAIRFTFTDSDDAFDEVLRPVLVSMLSLMLADPYTENRRLALGTLNAALQHKSDIVLPQIQTILPQVIKDSRIDQDLIREVQMGPFKHRVDDGLELRKSAYETLFSLLDTAYTRISPPSLFERVIEGLGDEHEIKMLCASLLTKLIILDPNALLVNLDPIAEAFKKILMFKPKENAVKQEVEKANEASKAVLTVTVRLSLAFPAASGGKDGVGSAAAAGGGGGAAGGAAGQGWRSYWEWLAKEQRDVLGRIENEVRSQAA